MKLAFRWYRHRVCSNCSILAVIVLSCTLATGCLPRSQPPPEITRLVLDDPRVAPEEAHSDPLVEEAITVIRFSAVEECRGTAMLYSTSPGERSMYRYHRWHTNLPIMVTEWITADLSRSGMFHAVFTDYAHEKSRFYLEGRVTDCLELRKEDARIVLFGLEATLIDQGESTSSRRIIFQKSYRDERYLKTAEAADLVRAMTESMAYLSDKIRDDIAFHIEDRLVFGGM